MRPAMPPIQLNRRRFLGCSAAAGWAISQASVVEAGSAGRPVRVGFIGLGNRGTSLLRASLEAESAEVVAVCGGDLGPLVSGSAAWISSNGPINGHEGWLSRRERSGDWMVEQAVHVWDVFHWVARGVPHQAFGSGRRDVFTRVQPGRDVTDDYQA